MQVSLPDTKLEAILGAMQKWTPEERSKYCDDSAIESHPLFTKQTGTAADLAANPQLAAVAMVDYDGVDTPEALAKEAKDKGNAAFTRGPDFYGHALRHYGECITHASRSAALRPSKKAAEEEDAEDALAKKHASAAAAVTGAKVTSSSAAVAAPSRSHVYTATGPGAKEMRDLISVAHANVAAIHLARRKYVSAVEAAELALRANPGNVKAAYRAAKACLALGRAVTAADFAQLGLELEPANGPLAEVLREATALRATQRRNEEAVRAEAEARAVALDALRAAARERGLKVGPPAFSDQRRTPADPYVDPDDGTSLHWPVLLLYPEYGVSDYLEDVEEGAPVGDIVSAVLPSEAEGGSQATAFPPWDERREYAAGNVDIFYRSNVCKPLPLEEAWAWARPGSVGDASGGSEGAPGREPPAPQPSGAASKWVRIPPATPLSVVLAQANHVIPDIPVLYVAARSGRYYAELRRRMGGAEFAEVAPP